MARIAFYTYGILREAKGHPLVQGIFDRFEATFAQLEKSAGFIDRDRGEWGDRMSPRFFDSDKHAFDLLTLSLWPGGWRMTTHPVVHKPVNDSNTFTIMVPAPTLSISKNPLMNTGSR